jgi:hypothetical protein
MSLHTANFAPHALRTFQRYPFLDPQLTVSVIFSYFWIYRILEPYIRVMKINFGSGKWSHCDRVDRWATLGWSEARREIWGPPIFSNFLVNVKFLWMMMFGMVRFGKYWRERTFLAIWASWIPLRTILSCLRKKEWITPLQPRPVESLCYSDQIQIGTVCFTAL